MTIDRRLLAGALGCTLLLAACGSSATPTPTAAPTATPTVAPTATPAPTATTGDGGPDISLAPGSASDLEAMIPSKVGTVQLQKTSFDYSTIPWASLSGFFNDGELDPILKSHGKTAADVRFAMGIAATGTGMPTEVFAFQLKGVPATDFATALDSSITSATQSTIGGKSVYASIDGGLGSATYLKDDIVFFVIGSEADITTILQTLP